MAIHPTAIVSPKAEIGKNVEIGPYTVIEDDVKIGDDCYIDAHVKIGQYTTIGPRCRIYFGVYIGEPQDHRFYRGIRSFVEIGADTVLREYVTVHRPPFEFLKTVIGDHVLLQAFVHIAHDCMLSDRVTISNHTALSGHCQVGPGAVISGYVLAHQFTRIGALAMSEHFAKSGSNFLSASKTSIICFRPSIAAFVLSKDGTVTETMTKAAEGKTKLGVAYVMKDGVKYAVVLFG